MNPSWTRNVQTLPRNVQDSDAVARRSRLSHSGDFPISALPSASRAAPPPRAPSDRPWRRARRRSEPSARTRRSPAPGVRAPARDRPSPQELAAEHLHAEQKAASTGFSRPQRRQVIVPITGGLLRGYSQEPVKFRKRRGRRTGSAASQERRSLSGRTPGSRRRSRVPSYRSDRDRQRRR